MENNELKYQLTALIDGEISDESKKAELNKQIYADPDLQNEYEILRFTKSLVQTKCKFRSAPDKLKKRIIKKIHSIENPLPQPFKFLEDIYSRPAFAISGALALILIAILLFFNQSSKIEFPDLAGEQSGTENMFIQASSNFNNIIAGSLTPQILTDDAENIRSFFTANGVKYFTQIPKVDQWKILGAVVSEAGGEKLAHHVYSNDKGKIIYLFQVDKACLDERKVMKLSEHLMKYLDEGNCYVSTKDDCTTLMKKMDNNICAIVSNASAAEIKKLFCSL